MPISTAPWLSKSKGENDAHPPQKRIFYGWWIVLGGMAVLMVSSGIGFYGHGLILDPLREAFGWSKGTISSAVTLFFMTAAATGLITGGQVDRHGPRRVLVFGATTIGLGYVLLGRIGALWQLYAVYILIAIGWNCTHVVPVNTMIANWFVRKRGLAMSVAMTGLSIGGVFLVPMASQAIYHWGLKISLLLFGIMFWVVIMPIALLVIKQRPSVMGLLPDGDMPGSSPETGPNSVHGDDAETLVWTRREAMGTRTFWAIVVAFLLALAGQAAFLVHEISFMSQFVGETRAATAISVTSIASIFGRLWVGSMIDRYDKRLLTMICFLLQGAAMMTAGLSTRIFILYISVFAFGLTIGNIVMLKSLIIGECFGHVSFGTVSGLTDLFVSAVTSLGPMAAGIIFDATQSYRTAFAIFAATSVLASVSIIFAKPPKKPDYRRQASSREVIVHR